MLYDVNNAYVIAYGAGNMTKEYLPRMIEHIKFNEIWDIKLYGKVICDFQVNKPHTLDISHDTIFIIFINDKYTRCQVSSSLSQLGFKYIYPYDLFLNCIKETFSNTVIDNVVVDTEKIEVNYYLVPCDIKKESNLINVYNKLLEKGKAEYIVETIKRTVLISDENKILGIIKNYEGEYSSFEAFAKAFELLLRLIFSKQLKTKYRSIKTIEDDPYDWFAIYEVMKSCFICWNLDIVETRDVLSSLYSFSNSKAIVALYCDVLINNGEYEKAYNIAANERHNYPNSLIISETYVKAMKVFAESEHWYPEYSLDEYVCWSGLNFAICEGVSDEEIKMAPCFRTLQCTARPGGEFWISDEWKEFRKSILDGSFRYCQKDRCPNLLGGWLPKKEELNLPWFTKLQNDINEIPPLQEIHFSYDDHCNLKCVSCRLEQRLNTIEKTDRLNNIYELKLKDLLKKSDHLTISGCGEAIISPHSLLVLQSLSSKEFLNLSVELRTNVVSITKSSWERLGDGRRRIRHITASVDGAKCDTFEKLRTPAKWEKMLEGLSFIHELRNNGEIDFFEIHVVIHDVNIYELFDILMLAKEYEADAITYSRMVNWRNMSVDEYDFRDPFWPEHPKHKDLMKEIYRITDYRTNQKEKKMFINIHGQPDFDDSYYEIRIGRLKVR